MGYIKLDCPACGASVEYFGDKEVFFCQYCGSKITKDKQYVELSGAVTVNGIASAEAFLERAFLFLEDKDYTGADSYFEKVLDISPKCSRAYIGKLMCRLQVSQMHSLADNSIPLTTYDLFNKAVRFSTPAEKEQYLAYNQAILDRLAQIESEKLSNIDALKSEIAQLQEYLEVNQGQHLKNKIKQVFLVALLILSVLLTMFFTIGLIQSLVMLVTFIPALAMMILLIPPVRKVNREISEYNIQGITRSQKEAELLRAEEEYSHWLQNRGF